MRESAPRPGLRDGVALVLWAAVLASGLELGGLSYLRFGEGRLVFVPRQAAWMVPMVHLAIAAGVGLSLALGSWIVRQAVTWRLAGFAAGVFVAIHVSLLFVPRLGALSVALLTMGVGATVARLLADPSGRLMRRARQRRWLVAASVGVALLGAPVGLWFGKSAAPAPGDAPRSGRPNILLIFLDTVRADHLSLYGYERPTTPNLEQFARGGAVFDQAVSAAPWTLPAHASALTGRWPFELSADWSTPLDDTYPTVAEALAAAGYRTAGFAANSRFLSYETGVSRGFQHYEDYPTSLRSAIASTALGRLLIGQVRIRGLFGTEWTIASRTAQEIRASFEAWLDTNTDERPFFAFLNIFDAHHPYVAPAPFAGRFGGPRTTTSLRRRLTQVVDPEPVFPRTRAGLDSLTRSYDESIAYVDAELGHLFERLERSGELDNTIVIITADHGEHLGEHGLVDHGNSLYYPLIRVPLIVRHGRHVPALRVSRPVTLRDLPATILDLAGVETPLAMPGTSLREAWVSAGAGSEYAGPVLAAVTGIEAKAPVQPISRGDMSAIVIDGVLLVRDGHCEVEVFDVETDPLNLDDLSDELSGELDTLQQELDRLAPRPACG